MTVIRGASNHEGAEVKDGSLLTLATTHAVSTVASHRDSSLYYWPVVSADRATADTILLVTNTSTTRNLVIARAYVYSDVPSTFTFHFPTYTASFTGTAVVGVCANRSNIQTAPATAYSDETGQASQGTILTVIHSNEVATDQFGQWVPFNDEVVLGFHDSFAVDYVGEMAALGCTFVGYFETPH